MKKKLKLIPVPVEWQAGKFGIGVESFEEDVLNIIIITTFFGGEDKKIKITFSSFAEFRFINLNFAEHNYNDYLIRTPNGEFVDDTFDWYQIKQSDYWEVNKQCYDSFFYIVENSQWYYEKEAYHLLMEKEFEHFIIVGYDSYVEILAEKHFKWIVIN